MNESVKLLEDYKNGVDQLNKLIQGITNDKLLYFPENKDSWSIKEHIIHLIDSEINGFIRLKSIIAQPGSDCYVMNEEEWTKNIRRKNEDINKYLKLFKLIRELSYDFIKEEDDSTWENQFFIRTYKGNTVKITIKDWLNTYVNHLKYHIEYIEKIYEEMNKKNL